MAASGASPHLAKLARHKQGEVVDWELDGIRVPAQLVQGTQLTKLSEKKGKSPKPRLFRLDADQGRILWESRRRGVIHIENIKELRIGSHAHSEIASLLPNQSIESVEDRWLTIIYTIEDEYKTLNVIAPTAEILAQWFTTLTALRQLRLDFMTGTIRRSSSARALWDRHHFAGADSSKDNKLSLKEVKSLCQRLNFGGTEEEIGRRFMEVDKGNKGHLTYDEFQDFVARLKERPDVAKVFDSIKGAGNFDFKAFQGFMKDTQKSKFCHEELEHIFRSLSPSTADKPAGYTPGPNDSPPPSIDKVSPWTLDSFASFLESGFNSAFSEAITKPIPNKEHEPSSTGASKIHQDMTQPLSSYYICSSHNTYIVGNQLIGNSSVEGYIRALLGGCRSVEMDIYDGPDADDFTGAAITATNAISSGVGEVAEDIEEAVTAVGDAIGNIGSKADSTTAAGSTSKSKATPTDEIIPGEPIVTHGGTLTSSLSVRRICEAIDRYAFVTSPYPVIISGELHCGVEQQKVLVRVMREVFGDKLVVAPVNTGDGDHKDNLPSPEALKGRILLKAKNKTLEPAKVAEEAEEEEGPKPRSESRASWTGSFKGEVSSAKGKASGMMGKMFGFMKRRSSSKSSGSSDSDKNEGSKKSSSKSSKVKASAEMPKQDAPPKASSAAVASPPPETSQGSSTSVTKEVKVPPPTVQVQAPTDSGDKATTAVTPGKPSTTEGLSTSQKILMAPELLSLLVYTSGVTFRGLGRDQGYTSSQMFSLSENKAKSLIHNPRQSNTKDSLRSSARDSALLVEHTRSHLVRVYPKGTRVDSSNYEPNVFWAMGCQLVTLNWQTVDRGWHINRAMYLRNGGAGFVLKPAALLDPEYPFNLHKYKPTKHVLRVRVISAQQLPRPKDGQGHEVVDKDTVDPYVKVAIHIPIWANGQSIEGIAPIPIAPVVTTDHKVGAKEGGKAINLDPNSSEAKPGEVGKSETTQEAILVESGAAGDEQAGAAVGEREVKVKTRTIRNNGFNPVWDEQVELPFDVFGGESMKDLIFVRFLVKDSNMDEDDFVGAYCSPLSCLEMGYRHLPLYDEQTNQILFAGLFVHLSVEDA